MSDLESDAATISDAGQDPDGADPPDAGEPIDAAPLPDAGEGAADVIPEGCVRATTTESRFVICDNEPGLRWPEADEFCESELGMRLARIHNDEENTLVRELGNHQRIDASDRRGIGLGATDAEEQGRWRWLSGSEPRLFWIGDASGVPQNDLYNDWHETEPTDGTGRILVIETNDSHDLQWNNRGDPILQGFACGEDIGDDELAEHCYRLETEEASYQICRQADDLTRAWTTARDFCLDLDMDLSDVRSQDEEELLWAALRGWSIDGEYALGGSDAEEEHTWVWVGTGEVFWIGDEDGEPQDGLYNNWADGEPNNQGGEQEYLFGRFEDQWDDVSNRAPDGWVCKQFE